MTKRHPLISVILPVYKEPPEFFKASYNSLLGQSYKNFEIITIIDNPNNQEAINFFSEQAAKWSHTSLHINEKNLGLIKSLNKGLELAKGSLVARMDSDDISLPERLELQLQYLLQNNCDLVGGAAKLIDFNSNEIGLWQVPQTKSSIIQMTKYHTPALHPTWLFKRDVIKSLDGYRELKHAEDHDLLARLLEKGFSIGNLQDPVIKYRVNPESVSNVHSQWAYWGRIVIGSCFAQSYSNQLTPENYEQYILKKLENECFDPREKVQNLKSSLSRRDISSSVSILWNLISNFMPTYNRIKNKVIISSILRLDRIKVAIQRSTPHTID